MKNLLLLFALLFAGPALAQPSTYHQRTGHPDAWSGGVRMIEITTPRGNFRVWTKRVGHNPRLKVLLLHGGPAATHEYLEAFDSFFPGEGIEYY
jgi:proline iminopeptidase